MANKFEKKRYLKNKRKDFQKKNENLIKKLQKELIITKDIKKVN